MTRRLSPEQSLHRAVAQYLSVALTPESWFSTIGHGGGGYLRGAILHGCGLKSGVPDILIIHEGCAYFLELKAPKGALSKEQEEEFPRIAAAGARIMLARNLGDVRFALATWNIPSRDALAACLHGEHRPAP
jgi:hypothetical protein